jgi:Fe-S-cluster containining protein
MTAPFVRPGSELPTVRALQQLWAQVAQRPLWAPPNFWRYVRLRRRMQLRRLDAAKLPRVGSPQKVNDCSSCTEICCVGQQSTVLLRLQDIGMLQDIGRTYLMTQAKPAFDASLLRQRPALRRQVNSAAWEIFPVLRQDRMHACAALDTAGRCGLYPHWPLACARFPYSLRPQEPETFYSRRCQSFWVHPAAAPRGLQMAQAAVAAYNERISDAILLAYVPEQLADLGLLAHLRL